jgi:AmmeMemoRadiSam system protein A
MRAEALTLGHELLGCARGAIADALGVTADPGAVDSRAMTERGASFVTLMQDDRLRGCIGTLEAHRSLGADVRANAVAAALRDPRFAPMRAGELRHTVIEVSVLGPARSVAPCDEAELLAMLRPHEDGLILAWRGRRATFLPQVWGSLPSPVDFLRELKLKAGLAADFWAADMRVATYRVDKWSERDAALARSR